MRDLVMIFPVFLGLVGCAGTSEIPMDRGPTDAFFRIATVEERAPDVRHPMRIEGTVYRVETRLVDSDHAGATIAAPTLAIYPGQRANVSVLNQVAYIETFTVEQSAEAVIADVHRTK